MNLLSLWHESFHALRRRFEAASDQHGALYCVMVERSSPSGHAEYGDFPCRQPPDASTVGGGVHLYGEPKIMLGEVRPPRAREWRLYGKSAAMEAFNRLAQDAGRLLGPSGPSTPDCIVTETLAADESQRWLWVIFDLAWNPIDGSPLAASRMAWAGNVSIPLDQVESQRHIRGESLDSPFGQALALIPDPPNAFFSVIEDLLAASYFAIDRLLGCASAGAQPEDDYEADSDASPRRRPKRTKADIARDEGNIAAYLIEHPGATRDEVGEKTRIARGHVSASRAWKLHKERQKEARKINRVRGVGGVGDPSVDRFGRDDDEG